VVEAPGAEGLDMEEALGMAEVPDPDEDISPLDMDKEDGLWVIYGLAAVVVTMYDGEGEAYVLYWSPFPEERPHCIWQFPRHWARAVSATTDVSVMV